MQEDIISLTEKSPGIKNNYFKKKKRKLSLKLEESGLNYTYGISKVPKKAFISKASEPDLPGLLHYKSTSLYTKVVAEPSSLPSPPGIFQINKLKSNKPNTYDSFLYNILSSDSLNMNLSERFSQVTLNNKKYKKKERKKNRVKEENFKEGFGSKKKKEMRKEKIKRALELQLAHTNNNDTEMKREYKSLFENKVDIYRIPEKETLIFHMYHPSKFSFQGELKITIITGEVEVLGYTLSSSSVNDSVDIYSPNFCTPLIVESKAVKQTKPKEDILAKLRHNMSESDFHKCCENLKPEDTILFINQIKSTFGVVINKYFDLPIFPKDLEDVFLMTDTLKSLQSIFTFKFSKFGKHFRKSPQWDRIPLGQCTILCGGKGVGKSTLLKYYINKFVTLGEKVLALDFDPGQPEFNFPGCVSAVIIDQPLVGPNFTHVMEPILMMNYGDVDVCQNPSRYLECVKSIIEYCRKNEDLLKMKWFVNTMGFCKGLGVSLTISILKLLKPNTVIQIKGSDYKNNYPFYLTPVTLNSKSGFRSMPLDDIILSYDLRVIYSCAELGKKQLQGGLKHRQLRDIMSISYFSKAVSPPFYNFNAIQPYVISFSKLYLGIDFIIDLNDVLKAFNGNPVSLSHFKPGAEEIFSVESEDGVYFKVVIKPNVAPSFGIGFVRGIDCQEKKFYILTHLPLETLHQVNCLTLGRVSAPHSMFLKQEAVEGRTVYTTPGTIDVIHRVKRMFRVPGTPQRTGKFSIEL